MFASVDPKIKQKIIEAHLAGHGRNQIDRELHEEGVKVSHGSISNIINAYKHEHEQPLQPQSPQTLSPQPEADAGISTGVPMNNIDGSSVLIPGSELAVTSTRDAGSLADDKDTTINPDPQSTTELEFIDFDNKPYPEFYPNPIIKPSDINQDAPTSTGVGQPITTTKDSTSGIVPKKVYPRDPILEDRFDVERRAWDYYGKAHDSIRNEIIKARVQRRHEEFLIDQRKKRLDERESNLKDREIKVSEAEPYLIMAKKLQEMKLTLEDTLPWIETINEVAQMQKLDIKDAALFVAQELRLYRQFDGIQQQIERANQELALVEMANIKKRQAITVIEDLLNKGITESQIQLITFAATLKDNIQQPLLQQGSNSQGPQQPNNPGNNGGPSMNDFIRLHFLNGATSNMLNKMRTN